MMMTVDDSEVLRVLRRPVTFTAPRWPYNASVGYTL